MVSEGRLQVELRIEQERVRAPLSSLFSGRTAEVAELLRSSGVPLMALSTAEPTIEQVRRLFGEACAACDGERHMSAPAVSALVPPDTSGQLQPLQELPLPQRCRTRRKPSAGYSSRFYCWCCWRVASWLVWRRREKQRYRRVALVELASIEASLAATQTDSPNARARSPRSRRLLKRTSLAVAPREQVAALTGDAWLAFLQRTRGRFDARSGALLALASYAPPDQVAAISQRRSRRR